MKKEIYDILENCFQQFIPEADRAFVHGCLVRFLETYSDLSFIQATLNVNIFLMFKEKNSKEFIF